MLLPLLLNLARSGTSAGVGKNKKRTVIHVDGNLLSFSDESNARSYLKRLAKANVSEQQESQPEQLKTSVKAQIKQEIPLQKIKSLAFELNDQKYLNLLEKKQDYAAIVDWYEKLLDEEDELLILLM